MLCRSCGRDHSGPECPIDQQGRPSPPPNIQPYQPQSSSGMLWFSSPPFTSSTEGMVTTVNVNITIGPYPRPPDDDGLAGVPALVR